MSEPIQGDNQYLNHGVGPYYDAPPPTNGLALAGFIVSLVGLVLGFVSCGMLSFICIVSLVLSICALHAEPRGLAIGGIVISTVGLTPLIMWFGLFSLGSASSEQARQSRQAAAVEREESLAAMERVEVNPEEFDSFAALNIVSENRTQRKVSIAEFGPAGPQVATAMPTNDKLRQLTFDSKRARYYAIQSDKFGRITESGQFSEIVPAEAPGKRFSGPVALDYLPDEDRVLILTRNGAFLYSEETGNWESLDGFDQDDCKAIAYDAENQVLYGLTQEFGSPAGEYQLVHLNTQGAVLKRVALAESLPRIDRHDSLVQLAVTKQGIVALQPSGVDDSEQSMRLFLIDPSDGKVRLIVPTSQE